MEVKRKVVGYVVEKGGLQGYLIDKKTADKFNIKSIMDIKKHAKEFDINDDGKADMVACPPGWGCEKIITKHFTELGVGEFINPLKADYSAAMADTISRYKNGKSILFYTWTPNWSVGTLKLGEDVVWIEAPYSDTKEVKVPKKKPKKTKDNTLPTLNAAEKFRVYNYTGTSISLILNFISVIFINRSNNCF